VQFCLFYGMIIVMNMQDNSAQIIEELNDKILILEQPNAELDANLKWYEEQFRLSRQKQTSIDWESMVIRFARKR